MSGTALTYLGAATSLLWGVAHLFPTPTNVLTGAKKIALEEGLNFVYIGNVAGSDSNTYCPKCKKPLVKRMGYLVRDNNITDGKCKFCGAAIEGIWSA